MTSNEVNGLIVFFVVQFNRRLVLVRLQRQQVAAQVVNNLFSGIAEEGCREAGSTNRT